jgi:hypothetical protein
MASLGRRAGVWAGEATRGHVGPGAEELLDRHGTRQEEGLAIPAVRVTMCDRFESTTYR